MLAVLGCDVRAKLVRTRIQQTHGGSPEVGKGGGHAGMPREGTLGLGWGPAVSVVPEWSMKGWVQQALLQLLILLV